MPPFFDCSLDPFAYEAQRSFLAFTAGLENITDGKEEQVFLSGLKEIPH